jgi:predicted nucleotidyltransferase
MTIEEIKAKLKSEEYDFLRDDKHLGNNIILLTLGGSYAYGTNNEDSDLDIRGIALNSKQSLLGINENFEQFVNEKTDTTVYSFNKIVKLLLNCNPNTCELLGNKPEYYFSLSPIGQELIDNAHLFLSKKACQSFGGYANQQLYRLNQKSAHQLSQAELGKHILKTLEFMKTDFNKKYSDFKGDQINLYIDVAVQDNYDTEIFMDVNLTHYPLRDYCSMWSELQNTVKAYSKIGKRNQKAIEHGKIAKHMMHLVRLYIMCLDILENEQIVTYREQEHDLLMDIRNGKFLDDNNQPIPEFFEMVSDYEKRLDYAKEHTNLPATPDYNAINEFVVSVNERIVRGEV